MRGEEDILRRQGVSWRRFSLSAGYPPSEQNDAGRAEADSEQSKQGQEGEMDKGHVVNLQKNYG